jgi:ATP-dependent DNA ligase
VLPKDGLSLFDRLHSGRFDREVVVLYGFDLLELDGADLRPLPLEELR